MSLVLILSTLWICFIPNYSDCRNSIRFSIDLFSCIMMSSFLLTWQVIMEIPLELMLTISKEFPWMFFPDIIPIGHPIFDIINSTNPEVLYINSSQTCFHEDVHYSLTFSLSLFFSLPIPSLTIWTFLWQTDWDLRLACLLLFALDLQGNFWQLYGDFLPSADECTSLLLATEVHVTFEFYSLYRSVL